MEISVPIHNKCEGGPSQRIFKRLLTLKFLLGMLTQKGIQLEPGPLGVTDGAPLQLTLLQACHQGNQPYICQAFPQWVTVSEARRGRPDVTTQQQSRHYPEASGLLVRPHPNHQLPSRACVQSSSPQNKCIYFSFCSSNLPFHRKTLFFGTLLPFMIQAAQQICTWNCYQNANSGIGTK